MTNTEMVIFTTKDGQGAVTTYYNTGDTTNTTSPTLQACYSTNYSKNGSNIEFVTTRPLDCNTKDSYVVKLNEQLPIISAWSTSSPDLDYHGKNYLQFTQLFSPVGTCEYYDSSNNINYDLIYEFHGVFMWATWVVIGLVQIFTTRYWKHYWRWNKLVHSILGILSLGLVTTAAF